MDIKQFYDILGKDDTIYKLALITGFMQVIACGDIRAPLSTICCAIIWASLYYLLVSVIIYICPEVLKPYVSLILVMSMLYYILKDKACEPAFKLECRDNISQNNISGLLK